MKMDYVVASAAIVGLVNGARLLKGKDYWGFALFALALITGAVLGFYNWFGLPGIEAGFAAGLVSSGFYRAAEKIGNS